MEGKLSQPGCFTNTGTGSRSGRTVVKLEVLIPENNRGHNRGHGRIAAMRKGEKKSKSGKKILGRQSSFLQFGSKPTKCTFQTEKEGVQCALRVFKRMWASMPSSPMSPFRVLAKIRRDYPHLLINSRHNGQGRVPGVEVGDCFAFRAELCLVGLHRRPQAGIDWKVVTSDDGNLVSIALSIVVSGGYEDDVDEGETLIYTGEGGNDWNRSKRQCEDQKLVGGNMALRNSYFRRNSVRVIRGRPDPNSSGGMLHSYDGLYQVVDYRFELGISKFLVYKFKLVREGRQSPLRWQCPVNSPRQIRRGFESPKRRGPGLVPQDRVSPWY